MTTTTKIIIGVSIVLVLGLSTGIIVKNKKKKSESEGQDYIYGTNEVETDDSQVDNLLGKKVYVSNSEPYANVRSSTIIENCGTSALGYSVEGLDLSDYECYTPFDETNIIFRATDKSNYIGSIIEVESMANDGFTWFKIKFNQGVKAKGGAKFGYVREDAIKVKNN